MQEPSMSSLMAKPYIKMIFFTKLAGFSGELEIEFLHFPYITPQFKKLLDVIWRVKIKVIAEIA